MERALNKLILAELQRQAKAPCRVNDYGDYYIKTNSVVRGGCYIALLAGLGVLAFLLQYQKESDASAILMGVIGLYVIIMSFPYLKKQFTLTDEGLSWGMFHQNFISYYDLQEVAKTNPPYINKQGYATFFTDNGKKIKFSLDAYYGSHEFKKLLEEKMLSNFNNSNKNDINPRGLILIFILGVVIFYLRFHS